MTELKISSLDIDNRLDELIAFNLQIHGDTGDFWKRLFVLNPASNRPEYHRFLLDNNGIIAGTSLLRHTIQWYGSTIDAGEIGLVGTLEEHRNNGHATTLMNDRLETMRADKIPISFLWGIPNFYERFHYYYGYPNHSTAYISLPKSCTNGWGPTETIRRAEPGDYQGIKKLYRVYNIDLNGCHVRDDSVWEWYFHLTSGTCKNGKHGWWVLDDPTGGYAFVAADADGVPKVWEIAVSSAGSLRNIVLGLFKEYSELDRLDFHHHPRMPVGEWLYHLGARISSPADIWKGTWGGMVRLNDPVFLLKRMTDKLNERISRSRFFNYTGTIAIECEIGSLIFEITDGQMAIHEYEGKAPVYIPMRVLTPITTGYRSFDRLRVEMGDIPDDVAELLGVLFPGDKVFMYQMLYLDEVFSI